MPGSANQLTRREVLVMSAFGALAAVPGLARAAAGPEGQLTWGVHVSLAPIWFDPAEISGIITPFMVLYALHDAMVKPMPGQPLAPSLAQSLSGSEDGLTYEFVLREGARFHNGDPVTAEDVKFSFERYRGTARDLMKNRVAAIETPDPRHVRFKLKEPWPDFLTFYGSASPARAGSCRRNTSKRSATRGSRRRRSAPGPTNSSRSHPASSWSSRRLTSTGASRRASSAWSSR